MSGYSFITKVKYNWSDTLVGHPPPHVQKPLVLRGLGKNANIRVGANSVTQSLCSGAMQTVATAGCLDGLVTRQSGGHFWGEGGPGDLEAGLSCGR